MRESREDSTRMTTKLEDRVLSREARDLSSKADLNLNWRDLDSKDLLMEETISADLATIT